ncbi:MAG TPA: STAS domain-containing protein [Streptomyces sp.]|nr:STAS domain-containing protein [Streptomyces sp.]
MNQFTAVTRHHTGSTVITAGGEMDLDSFPALEEATSGLPRDGRTLYVEMSAVSFMDSSGLTFLLKLRLRLLEQGGRLCVTGLQAQPAHVLRLTQTYPLLVTDATAAA